MAQSRAVCAARTREQALNLCRDGYPEKPRLDKPRYAIVRACERLLG